MDYEQWTLAEIARLRAVAKTAAADADTLQRTLSKWRESSGQEKTAASVSNESPMPAANELNGHTPRRSSKRTGYGDKNALALAKIKASPTGLTIDELYKSFVETYGPKYKRSSMRALLWHQRSKVKNVELRNGRYVAKETAG